jgi:hypothetical protein
MRMPIAVLVVGAAAIALVAGCTSSGSQQVARPVKLLLPPGPALPTPSSDRLDHCTGVRTLQRTIRADDAPPLNRKPSCISRGGEVVLKIRIPECFGLSQPASSDPSVLAVVRVTTDRRATVRVQAEARARGTASLGGELMPTCDPEGPPEWPIAWAIQVSA